MDHKEITNPSMGSNELGRVSTEENLTASILSGTDTQMHLAALGAKKKKDENPDHQAPDKKDEFTTMEETDE
ncbi:MAG: hypothetical protein KGM98_14895 [Bacteroidota bacterium]|nr:hypothetical protein [Bacteroidota bacterium]